MGDLIMMTRTAPSMPARPPYTGGDAEILFFTGVRYYRIEDDVPVEAPTKSRRRAAKAKASDALRPDHQV